MPQTTNLGLSIVEAAQSQKHVPVNESLDILDAIVQLGVVSAAVTAPPASPTDGQRWIVPSGATGDWSGQAGNIAAFQNGAWVFYMPKQGWTAFNNATSTLLRFDGSEWVSALPSTLALLGVNTTADATNKMAVKSDAVLFSHDDVTPGTGDVRVTLNKSAAAKDAGFTFQDGFSTRALFGLLGDDDISIKVSPDGLTFHQALTVDKDTGNIAIGAGSDANNKLLVSGENMLFTNNGDLRFVFNKGATSNDAALTFQSNFSARALIGLLGDDNFTFKVSPDSSNFHSAMVINKDNGQVSFPQGSKFSAYMFWNGPDQYIGADGWTKVGFNNTRHNDQSAYDGADYAFVAPADGYYLFGAKARFRSDTTDPTRIQMGLSVNFGVPTLDNMADVNPALAPSQTVLQLTGLLKLNTGDKVYVLTHFTGQDGYILDNENYFWGCRIA
ncbi:MAG: DUF2793 domain-containing protein [Burkholderiaceae bacterium]|nr:DUF2793 domain-containing protein [Burkholderiaceae bacterium]